MILLDTFLAVLAVTRLLNSPASDIYHMTASWSALRLVANSLGARINLHYSLGSEDRDYMKINHTDV